MEETGASMGEQWDAIVDEMGAADRPDTLRLIKYLSDHGASQEELVEAARTASLGALALELALRAPGDLVSFDVAAEQAGLDIDEAAGLWRALGFPDPPASAAEGHTEPDENAPGLWPDDAVSTRS
jgi:hypothetical protein